MRRLLLCLGFLFFALTPASAEEPFVSLEVEDLLANRDVLGVIPFSQGCSQLDAIGKREVDRLVSSLATIPPEKKLIRIEGISPEGVPSSLQCAFRVAGYLRDNHHFEGGIYMTGLKCDAEGGGLPLTRAEVVLYDNIWAQEQIPVKMGGR